MGFVNEQETQILSYVISEKALGAAHPATLIAKYGIGYVFSGIGPGLSLDDYLDECEPQRLGNIELEDIETFEDNESDLNYFG